MRQYQKAAISPLHDWLRVATDSMRKDLCRRAKAPYSSIQSIAYRNRKEPRIGRGLAIVDSCNAIRQEILASISSGAVTDQSVVIPPLLTPYDLVDGTGGRHDEQD